MPPNRFALEADMLFGLWLTWMSRRLRLRRQGQLTHATNGNGFEGRPLIPWISIAYVSSNWSHGGISCVEKQVQEQGVLQQCQPPFIMDGVTLA
jgi:hypothetical protein